MILTSYAELGGVACFDAEKAAEQFGPLPDIMRCNSYACPVGAQPGVAWVLLTRGALESIGNRTAMTLKMSDGVRTVEFPSLIFDEARRIDDGGVLKDNNALFACRLWDKRRRAKDSACSYGANLPGSLPKQKWSEVINDLFSMCPEVGGGLAGLQRADHSGNGYPIAYWFDNPYYGGVACLNRTGLQLVYDCYQGIFGVDSFFQQDQTNTVSILTNALDRLKGTDEPQESASIGYRGLLYGYNDPPAAWGSNVSPATSYWYYAGVEGGLYREPATRSYDYCGQPLRPMHRPDNRLSDIRTMMFQGRGDGTGGFSVRPGYVRRFAGIVQVRPRWDCTLVVWSAGVGGLVTSVSFDPVPPVDLPSQVTPWPKLRGVAKNGGKPLGKNPPPGAVEDQIVVTVARNPCMSGGTATPYGGPCPAEIVAYPVTSCIKSDDRVECFFDGGFQRYEAFPVCDDDGCPKLPTPGPTPTPVPSPNPDPTPPVYTPPVIPPTGTIPPPSTILPPTTSSGGTGGLLPSISVDPAVAAAQVQQMFAAGSALAGPFVQPTIAATMGGIGAAMHDQGFARCSGSYAGYRWSGSDWILSKPPPAGCTATKPPVPDSNSMQPIVGSVVWIETRAV